MLDATYAGGFDDGVLGPQFVFRLLLDAMASPGSIADIGETLLVSPPPLNCATAAILLTMTDLETPVWLSPRHDTDLAQRWIRFHTGAQLASNPDAAEFAVTGGQDADGALASFAMGDERYPERSTTVIVACDALEHGRSVMLSGPGLEVPRHVSPAGLREGFWTEVQNNNDRFPLGVDLVFTSGARFFCIPRSTRIELKVTA